jgi:3-oxoacyl-[acyl-carrier protein] reductase
MELKGQTAIVTGAGQGMGRGIAEKLSMDGAMVVVSDKNETGARETANLITAGGGEALAVFADIADTGTIEKMFVKCIERFGRPDILVANAGLSYMSPLLSTSEEEYYRVFDINAKGTLFCLKAAGTHLADNGRIVVISSSTTRYPNKGMILYTATKAAQKAMVEVAALELAERGITVNSVMPGLTETPNVLAGLPQEFRKQIMDKSPFGRLGKPEDIAEVVAFLCSRNSRWVTGQHILVNGGGTV